MSPKTHIATTRFCIYVSYQNTRKTRSALTHFGENASQVIGHLARERVLLRVRLHVRLHVRLRVLHVGLRVRLYVRLCVHLRVRLHVRLRVNLRVGLSARSLEN